MYTAYVTLSATKAATAASASVLRVFSTWAAAT
jgi:hypothetical protein